MEGARRLWRGVVPFAAAAALCSAAPAAGARPVAARAARSVEEAATPRSPVPLLFERNRGQGPAGAEYVARSGRSSWSFADDGFALTDGARTIRVAFSGSSGTVVGQRRTTTRVTYMRGNDRGQWARRAPSFRRLRYRGLYPGVDAVFHPNRATTEYDFELAPGADPDAIELRVDGGKALVGADGALEVRSGAFVLRQERPRAFQRIGRTRSEVPVRYVVDGARITLRVGAFDRSRPLVIDPVISYSTFLGGSDSADIVFALEADAEGNLYVAGAAGSPDFPTTRGAYQRDTREPGDAFVAKFRPNGRPAFITLVGGSSHPDSGKGGSDSAYGVAVDRRGRVYLVGGSTSPDYPLKGAFDSSIGNARDPVVADAIVTVLSVDGSELVYSTFLGGSEEDSASGVAPRPDGSIWVGGGTSSSDFPVVDAYQPEYARGSVVAEHDAFVARIAPSGDGLAYSTYLGGAGVDFLVDLKWSAGHIYVAGHTETNYRDPEVGFPTTPGALKRKMKGEDDDDAFVTKFGRDPSELAYSTLLGGSRWEDVRGFDVDREGHAYVSGMTPSRDFPTKRAHHAVMRGTSDAYLTKLNSDGGGLVYSTFFGEYADDWLYDVAADGRGRVHATGKTASNTLVQRRSIQPLLRDDYDGVVATFGPRGRLEFATYLGGRDRRNSSQEELEELTEVAVSGGNVYVAGRSGPRYPTRRAFQRRGRGTLDVVITRLRPLRHASRHATKVSLRLTRTDLLRGRVRVPDAFSECRKRRRVVLERDIPGFRVWERVWAVPTDRRGRFRFGPQYDGRYRVEVSSSLTRAGGGWHLCGATTSRVRTKAS